MKKKLTTNEWIEKAKLVHADKYDYSKSEYTGSQNKICIICKKHGEFWQIARNHLSGNGCPKCSKTQKGNLKTFIEKAKRVHGDKYDYSKVEYINKKKN